MHVSGQIEFYRFALRQAGFTGSALGQTAFTGLALGQMGFTGLVLRQAGFSPPGALPAMSPPAGDQCWPWAG